MKALISVSDKTGIVEAARLRVDFHGRDVSDAFHRRD